jgi:hypothetical protein
MAGMVWSSRLTSCAFQIHARARLIPGPDPPPCSA